MQEPTHPYPPRFWWLKRIALGWLIILTLLLITRLIWGWEINRRINNQLAQWRAQGQPTRPEDFAEPDVPDEENAALVLKKIKVRLSTALEKADLRDESALPLSPRTMKAIEQQLGASRTALAQVRSIRNMPAVRWGYGTVGDASDHWGLSPEPLHSQLPSLLHWAALHAHSQGHDAEAVEYVRDLLCLSRAIGMPAKLEHGLIAMHPRFHAWQTVQQIACDFNGGSIPANAEQIQGLMAALADEAEAVRPLIVSLCAQRCWDLTICRLHAPSIVTGVYTYAVVPDPATGIEHHAGWLIMPAIDAIALKDMGDLTALVRLIGRPDPLAVRNLGRPPGDSEPGAFAVHDRLGWLHRHSNNPFDINRRELPSVALNCRTETRAAAILLAIRLFQLDHAGRCPARLDELAPKYLPIVPDDPFADKPFRYEPTANPPFLLSVGENGIDDLAAAQGTRKEWRESRKQIRGHDRIYLLARPLRPSDPEAVQEHNQEVDNGMQPNKPAGEEENP